MAERMRTDILFYAGHLRLLFDHMKHHDTRKPCPPAAQEKNIFIPLLYRDQIPIQQIILYLPDSRIGDRDKALLAPFPFHFDKTFIKINIRIAQGSQLGNTQSATVQHFQHRPVTLAFRQGQVDRIEYVIYLVDGQNFG